jgi:casein kinase II subunit beta
MNSLYIFFVYIEESDSIQMNVIEKSAKTLYGLIHQRYILTKQGMAAMLEKLIDGAYGTRYFNLLL